MLFRSSQIVVQVESEVSRSAAAGFLSTAVKRVSVRRKVSSRGYLNLANALSHHGSSTEITEITETIEKGC